MGGSLQRTKYALHVNGYQPFSPRLFEAIAAGAVPIIISPGYVLPFEDILDWSKFSVAVPLAACHKLYDIIGNIGMKGYRQLARNLAVVQHHFKYNRHDGTLPGDAFYMTMYSTYLRSK